ncbi:hypothetical protein LB504_006759 [Fusarium proliferatum]|nr:hypothetical protein LB504_006759 [Fusarium proliferatum]
MRNKALLHTDSLGLDKDPLTHRLEEMEHALHLQIRVYIFLASRFVRDSSLTDPVTKENSAKATLYQVFCYCCVGGGSLLSTLSIWSIQATKASQQAHTVMAEWHPTYVEKLALTSEAKTDTKANY